MPEFKNQNVGTGPGLKDKQGRQSDLTDVRGGAADAVTLAADATPEGLKRERKGPLNPGSGRAQERAKERAKEPAKE
jgi:hypothetical protein